MRAFAAVLVVALALGAQLVHAGAAPPTKARKQLKQQQRPGVKQVKQLQQLKTTELKTLRILALGDSITQGSVPSKNYNHPYVINTQKVLQAKLGPNVSVVAEEAAVGGSGVFIVGMSKPVTLIPHARDVLAGAVKEGKIPQWVTVMAGINDLLKGGYPADAIMPGLEQVYQLALDLNASVVAIPPLATTFVSRDDYKERERIKLAGLMKAYAVQQRAAQRPNGPMVHFLDLEGSGAFDFWAMSPEVRVQYLDDGLHLTEAAYDKVGAAVADFIYGKLFQNKRVQRVP